MIRKVGSKWVLFAKKKTWDKKRKVWRHRVLGRHATRAGALRQERAIWARRRKR